MLNDREPILVGQAVFTSSQDNNGRGYHLVARSSEIRDPLARHLARWGPAHGSLLTDAHEGSCLNYLPIDSEWATVSRTMYGGPEYSHRGALRVVTLILALRLNELVGYDNDPITFARTAMLLGYLRLSSNMSEQLPDVYLPAKPPHAIVGEHDGESASDALLAQSIRLLNQGERIALLAGQSASTTLKRLIEGTPISRRLQFSFTTGLKPSPERRFRIHLLPFVNSKIHRQLSALGIHYLTTSA